ncbi:MAG: hypothetical protein A7315_03705 [Candidatus Altiarchaeales archaeon WOR_SM1_79]|nr:MAG: hypothetical protein A7315_03705 [Candidatus Altiarchaeales archaeon WOR_SM1_79]
MDLKKYNRYRLITTIAVGFLVGLFAVRGEPILAILAVIIGMMLLYLLRIRVKQVIEDERIYKISEKASRRTVQVIGATTAVLGLAIIGLSRSRYLELTEVGFSLAYFATALLTVYMIFYSYYAKKLGE